MFHLKLYKTVYTRAPIEFFVETFWWAAHELLEQIAWSSVRSSLLLTSITFNAPAISLICSWAICVSFLSRRWSARFYKNNQLVIYSVQFKPKNQNLDNFQPIINICYFGPILPFRPWGMFFYNFRRRCSIFFGYIVSTCINM